MPPRKRRRAVGPPGARPARDEPRVDDAFGDGGRDEARVHAADEDDRFRAERPPHHDQAR
jgi:hypothetical protein